MSEEKDSAEEPSPVVTFTPSQDAEDDYGPLSVTTNLPPASWPPKTVGDLMTRKVITIGETEPVGDLEADMARFRFLHLPVVSTDMRLVGLITRTDYLHARLGVAGDGRAIEPYQAGEARTIMRKVVVVARLGDSLAEACRVMLRERIHCLPVVLDDNTLVGILTSSDFLRLALTSLERDESGATDVTVE
ncbi:MAG: CBS domain-containing protein [Polyangiaceae bacterium]